MTTPQAYLAQSLSDREINGLKTLSGYQGGIPAELERTFRLLKLLEENTLELTTFGKDVLYEIDR